jgi:hypothetical protein
VWKHSDTTIDVLTLDTPGRIPWRPARDVTLRSMLVHVLRETSRHTGQADILREGIDGAIGMLPGNPNLPEPSPAWWKQNYARIEQAARTFVPAAP